MPPFDAVPAKALNAHAISRHVSGAAFGNLINLSGRRRFTSQRLALYAVLAEQNPGAGHMTIARDALKLLTDAHRALVQGNRDTPGIFCDELHNAYFGPLQADAAISAFISLGHDALAAVERRAPAADGLVTDLIDSAARLLPLLNEVTQLYEALARRHAEQAQQKRAAVMHRIETIAKQARMVAFNAKVVAVRAGSDGREFSVVASALTDITGEIDELVRQALGGIDD
ncbi:methyl-accepting chemotaxis protein [Noviherbaspirillum denitrificans]|uniref:Methyl-accepting transducer domain-containing protein n=1 Tax=Noviherbaspirillum denitrificans TaxID=1968433 RepID=A0A254T796_9BURK|nr:methyl-accepting chemotaxis protein [Noviherbaspirillum denitrificans]OWW18445.1 hypothetical protein AYR66_00375 [Noviherbaspirillum denitrificans]